MVILEATGVSSVTSALTTAFTTGAGEIMDGISAILPVSLPIVVAVTVIGIGIKVFKKVTGK